MENDLTDLFVNNSYTSFVPNEEMSSDLQKKLKRINKLPNGLYETKFKIDRYKFDRACKNELSEKNALENLFNDIQAETGTHIILWMKSKSNSKLRNPLVNVIGSLEGIEFAKERVLSVFENIKMRVVLKMDVSYKDHSHIIGRGGFSIQRVMDDTGSHIHFPDSNRISDVKKSNVVLVCGSPTGVEQARCKIRSLLPLVVHFKIPFEYLKRTAVESHSKHVRSIQQIYNVHISIRNSNDIDDGYAAIFDSTKSSNYIAVSVRGQNNELAKLKESLSVLINRLTDCNVNLSIAYALTIEITEFYHQLVMGTNFQNIKQIMQQTGCCITFPDVETNQRQLDFDNLNEIPVNKSTVIIKGPSFEAVHQAWKELIGYLPLVLTFDVAHDQLLDTALINQLKKQFKVAIFLKHKEKYNTVIIRGIEKNSRALFEVRKQLLKLEDAEIPICCNNHATAILSNGKLLSHLDENCNNSTENSVNLLNSLISSQQNGLNATGNLNLLNGNAANILNAKMMQSIDTNNNPLNEKNHNMNNFANSNDHIQHMINPMLFQAVLQEQCMLLQQQQQQLNLRNSKFGQPNLNSMLNGTNGQSNTVNNVLANININDEMNKLLRQQNGLIECSLRNTHSVNDISSLQTNPILQNDSLHQNVKKEHLTSSCSSPSLHAMVMQQNNQSQNSSMLNNFSMNNSNLNSTGNNNTSGTSNASSSTANNSFSNNNGLNSPPTNNNLSFNSSLINNQSSMQSNSTCNWPVEQRRQLTYDECKYLALKNTYEKQDVNEVRIPSSVWSGLGFSKSMSQDTIRNKMMDWHPMFNSPNQTSNLNPKLNSNSLTIDDSQKHRMNTGDSNDLTWSSMLGQTSKQRSLVKQESEICSTSHPYSSNYLNNLINANDQAKQFTRNSIVQSPIGKSAAASHRFNSTNGDHLDTFIDVNKIDLATVLLEYGLAKFIDIFKRYKIDFAQFLSLTEDNLSNFGIDFHNRRKVYTAIIELRRVLQSNLVGNNYEKSNDDEKHQEDELSVAINKELKSFSSTYGNTSVCSSGDDQQPTNKQLVLFGDPSSLDSKRTETNEETISNQRLQLGNSKSLDSMCNAFDTFKLANKDIVREYNAINGSNELTSVDENFEMNTNGDALDDKKPIATDHCSREESAKLINSNAKTMNEEDECLINQHPSAVSSNQDLIKQSVQEIAQA